MGSTVGPRGSVQIERGSAIGEQRTFRPGRRRPSPLLRPSMPIPPSGAETIELVSAYYRIDDSALRRRLFELARALAVGTDRSEHHTPRPDALRR